MESVNQLHNKITEKEIVQVLYYFSKLGYRSKSEKEDFEKLTMITEKYPDKDFVRCAEEMYMWFDEAKRRGRKVKSYFQTYRNWISKDYAPKKTKQEDFFTKYDI